MNDEPEKRPWGASPKEKSDSNHYTRVIFVALAVFLVLGWIVMNENLGL